VTTQNVKDLVVPIAMVGALLGQMFYLGRASQRLDTTVETIAIVNGKVVAQDRDEVAIRADIRNLENQLASLKGEADVQKLKWEKDHYQLLARRVVQP
jgi:hypothetical protein